MSPGTEHILGKIWRSAELHADFHELCRHGGRLCGTESEATAYSFLEKRMRSTGGSVKTHVCSYNGWKRDSSTIRVLDGNGYEIPSVSLINSPDTPAGGLDLDVVDLGRGAVEEFQASRERIRGGAVLVHHEFFFSQTHVPRRRKYALAKEMGAAAFLIANYVPGAGPVNGVGGRGASDDIPGVGMSYEDGERLRQLCKQGRGRVRVEVRATRAPAVSNSLIAEVPGKTDEWVVLSAHYDGQHLGQSAMDNATGSVAVLEAFRAMAPSVPGFRRGLRMILFTLEHWGLWGSSLYVKDLSASERSKIAVNINLDTVGGGRLTALTGGVADVEQFVRTATGRMASPDIVRAIQINSDHYNFYLAGIPSLRLISGFEDPDSNTKFMMSASDTADKVDPVELRAAAMTAAELALAACTAAEPVAKHRRPEDVLRELDLTDPWVSDRVQAGGRA